MPSKAKNDAARRKTTRVSIFARPQASSVRKAYQDVPETTISSPSTNMQNKRHFQPWLAYLATKRAIAIQFVGNCFFAQVYPFKVIIL